LEKEDKIDLRVLETSQNPKSRSGKPSRDGEKKSFGFKGKSSFRDKKKVDQEDQAIKRWREKKFWF
jgi:predicted RNA-binding protein with RPS1 domain